MPSITGSFSGKITKNLGLPLTDQPNHELGIGEVNGTQKSPDPLWNDASITYWGVTELLDGAGTQRGFEHDQERSAAAPGHDGRRWDDR